jgi:hypothetical protein
MNETMENNCTVMALVESRWGNGNNADNDYLNRLMWWINFSRYESLALKYFGLKKNTTIKIFNQSICMLAIKLKVSKTFCPNRDDLQKILDKEFINRMKEVKQLRQKHSFSEYIRRRDAKLSKARMSI